MEEINRQNQENVSKFFNECFDNNKELFLQMFGTLDIKDLEFDASSGGITLIKYSDGDIPKCFFFDCETHTRCSNIMDVLYSKNNCFLKSFRYGDKVRVFMGRLYYCPITVREWGCDVNANDVILMPLDENGLLDEEEMMNDIKKERKDIGISIDEYKKAISDDFTDTMFHLKVYEFGIMIRMDKYEDYSSRKGKPLKRSFF